MQNERQGQDGQESAGVVFSSGHFCASDADAMFLSSEGVRFHIHRRNLDVVAGRFPTASPSFQHTPPPSLKLVPLPPSLQHPPLQLDESTATLELLFNFVYPQRYPSLANESFARVAALAAAAEKYEVFPAIEVCRYRMSQFIDEHPVEVLDYATRYFYNDLADQAAVAALDVPKHVVTEILDREYIPAWVIFYRSWISFVERLTSLLARPDPQSDADPACQWRDTRGLMIARFEQTLDVHGTFESVLEGSHVCTKCRGGQMKFLSELEKGYDGLPRFSELRSSECWWVA